MKKALFIGVIIQATTVLPIWFYLLYKILSLINASELMWFLFWIYVPLDIVTFSIFRIINAKES